MYCNYVYIVFNFFLILALSSCGRKQRNFLNFQAENKLTLLKLDLPAVKGITAQKTSIGIHISWLPLFTEKTTFKVKSLKSNFVGFNLFKLVNNATFIPKKPINDNPITNNFFLDQHTEFTGQTAYTVQAIFKFNEQIISGPSSRVIIVK